VSWQHPGNRFDLTRVTLVPARRTSGSVKLKPGKVRVTAARRKLTLAVDVVAGSSGAVRFSLKAKHLTGSERVLTLLRRSP
jgi:hypothetical protein